MASRHQVRSKRLRELRKRRSRRRIRLESLESRMLLAAGPQLISINPNNGEVLEENAVRNVAPREFVFRLDDNQQIDTATLDGIRITRSGGDEEFENASWISDLNTDGRVFVEFQAKTDGLAGNGVTIEFGRNDPRGPGLPQISVENRTVNAVLNVASGDKSTAANLVDAINQHPQASQLIEARVLTELFGQTNLLAGEDIASPFVDDFRIVLDHANKARSLVGLVNAESDEMVGLQFVAIASGVSGNGVIVDFVPSAGSRGLTVNGNKLTIRYDTSAGLEYTANELVTLINEDPVASRLVRVDIMGGNSSLVLDDNVTIVDESGGEVATIDENGQDIDRFILLGANDHVITPGYIGVDPIRPNEAIVRFAEALPDDVYQIDIFGQDGEPIEGQAVERAVALRNTNGEPFDGNPDTDDDAEDLQLRFTLNLGAQIAAVVPQPIVGSGANAIQVKNEIHVYFNDDDLHDSSIRSAEFDNASRPSVVQPSFYRLVFTGTDLDQPSLSNLDDHEFLPSSVEYDPEIDRAILTFDSDLDQLTYPDPNGGDPIPVGPGTFRLRIGSNESLAAPPIKVEPEIGNDPTPSSFDTAIPLEFATSNDVQSLLIEDQELDDQDAIHLYRFELPEAGLMSIEALAARNDSSLDPLLTLYRESYDAETDRIVREVIARNDDYYDLDSQLTLTLGENAACQNPDRPCAFYLGLSSAGNHSYDPTILDTGSNGVARGEYSLRLTFRPNAEASITDADQVNGISQGTTLDGDADGIPGGVHDFWFRAGSSTIFVDKRVTRDNEGNAIRDDNGKTIVAECSADAGAECGTVTNPHTEIATALELAQPGDIVRVLGKQPEFDFDGFVDRTDIAAYEIGFGTGAQAPADASSFRIPRGVTVMVDSGAIFKMRNSIIEVGSSAPQVDRHGGILQVLGTPIVVGTEGELLRDTAQNKVSGNVFFTSYGDETLGHDTNSRSNQTARPGDWGGILFKDDLDKTNMRFRYEDAGTFLNHVNQADIRYGGGIVNLNSVAQVVTPIQMVDSRPTITFNTITSSADAAMSATPDSFEETTFASSSEEELFTPDFTRVGPEIHGNHLLQNTVNGLFVGIDTPSGGALEELTVTGRWDDTDVVHVIVENLKISGDGSLSIDPGILTKLDGTRIELASGSQLLGEGLPGLETIFTSLSDRRYGAGGTFGTSNESGSGPRAGDWAGIYNRAGNLSLEHAIVAYGGGISRVEGTFAGFNPVEIRSGQARIAETLFENNASGLGGQGSVGRSGRGTTAAAVIYVFNAQPIVVGNFFLSNDGPPINIDANSMITDYVVDYGRSIGNANAFVSSLLANDYGNQGPLVRNNDLEMNRTNGMEVRGGFIFVDSVWDDTDIVHVLFDEIYVDFDFSLRLESSPTESLVVKLQATGGFTAAGTPNATNDRIGGALQVVGQPGHPVELTSFEDDNVGAGTDGRDLPQNDTNGRGRPLRTGDDFDIIINYGPTILTKPQAVLAVETAVQWWEQLLEDPITLVFDFELEPIDGPSNQIGGATGISTLFDFDQVRGAMISDGRTGELPLLQQLPSFNDLNVILPEDPFNPYSVSDQIELTLSNARALGLAVNRPPSAFYANIPGDVRSGRDDDIRFDIAEYWDYDRSDGIHPQALDFFDTVVHEIGHALGFVSAVPDIGSPVRQIQMYPMDLFRLQPGEGKKDFEGAARLLDANEPVHVFYDGGVFDPSGIPMPGLTRGDIPMSSWADGNQASHWKDDSDTGVWIGIEDPTAPAPTTAITGADRSAFDLIGWDVVGGGTPRDWQGITFETFTNDRNVALITELEAPDVSDPLASNSNSDAGFAEFLGTLATEEKASDDIRLLGFQVHGFLNEPTDVDVYSFRAKPGTEVWLDIDVTTWSLDTVVELISVDNNVLALSDNSSDPPVSPDGSTRVFSLDKSPYIEHESANLSNPRDAGLRLLLPGEVSADDEVFHVRVSSMDGLTSGAYQLQIRLREADEVPGTTVRLSNINYASSGIRARGTPGNSPLIGEAIEDGSLNDGLCSVDLVEDCLVFPDPGTDFIAPQLLGELTGTERPVISVAGELLPGDPADWYQFSLSNPDQYLIIDVDYATELLERPDTAISLYDADGLLVYHDAVSLDIDDLGTRTDDLSRGTFDLTDPMIGPIPAGSYFLAVHPQGEPPEYTQFTEYLPTDPIVRVEPNPEFTRINDDNSPLGFRPVPFHLGDITLFATTDFSGVVSGEARFGQLHTVDPFTGQRETTVGSYGPEIGDVAMRDDGRLFSLSLGINHPDGPTDENSGNFIEITPNGFLDPDISLVINDPDGELIDDGIMTFESDPDYEPPDPLPDPPPPVPLVPSNEVGVGMQFTALTYGQFNGFPVLYAVGSRGEPAGVDPPIGPEFTKNFLYVIDGGDAAFDGNGTPGGTALPQTGLRSSPEEMEMTAFTDIVERGHVGYVPPRGTEGTVTGIALVGATMYAVTDQGEFFRINNYSTADPEMVPAAAATPPIKTFFRLDADGNPTNQPIRFTSLTIGPPVVDGNRYSSMLFAMDSSSNLYAFDTSGDLQPIFVDGATSVRVNGLGGPVNGIAFGTRTRNPWANNGGTLLFQTDPTMTPVEAGQPNPGTLDIPGGVYGSIVSNPFSLAGYSTGDSPYLYFDYNLPTQNDRNSIPTPADVIDNAIDTDGIEIEAAAAPNVEGVFADTQNPDDIDLDTLRVYIADGTGGWELLASSVAGEEFNGDPVVELYDNSWHDERYDTLDADGNPVPPLTDVRDPLDPISRGVIDRQARISLEPYAGLENLRLRFEYSTAGTTNLGDQNTTGSELRIIAGVGIPDGSTFEIDNETFEFERGLTLSSVSAAGINDTDTIEVTVAGGGTTVFEFDLDSSSDPANTAVPFTPTDTAEVIADALRTAFATNNIAVFGTGNKLNLPDVETVVSVPNFSVEGEFGISDLAFHEVQINADMSANEVRDAIIQVLANVFSSGNTDVIKNYDSTISIIGHRIRNSGPLGMANRAQRAGEEPGQFGSPLRGQFNSTVYVTYGDEADEFEAIDVVGTTISGITIGFTSNGEAVTDSSDKPPQFSGSAEFPGTYQVEIRATDQSGPLDVRDRISSSITLLAIPGYQVTDGATFAISDGVDGFTFEFDDVPSGNGLSDSSHVAIPFDPSDTAADVAAAIRDAINDQAFAVDAISPNGRTGGTPASERVDLLGLALLTEGVPDSGIPIGVLEWDEFGSSNLPRVQGQLRIESNQITNSGEYGIIYEDAFRDLPTYSFLPPYLFGQYTAADYNPHASPVRHLITLNDDNLVPGITISNNVVAESGRGGIHISGDPNGIILIAPTVGPGGSTCEAWDGDQFEIFDIPDSQVDANSAVFEFDFNNDGLNNANAIAVSLPSQTPPPCMSAGTYRPTVADAIETAIRSSNLDVQTYRGKADEIFIEGAVAFVGVNNPTWSWPDYIADAQIGQVPFARIVNNTIVGHGGTLFGDAELEDVGILVDENANPTILNNVLANLTIGIQIDGDIRFPGFPDFSSQATIVGSSIYRDNVRNVFNIGIGDFSIELDDGEPLFVGTTDDGNYENGNYYPNIGSRLIDSSVDSLEDRPQLVGVKTPIGIQLSPILAPILDVTGLLRVDDPDVEPPEGFGRNVFKDRGAIDRADFDGPTAELLAPRDNDEANKDIDTRLHRVQTFEPISTFVIQINDRLEFATSIQGTGADPRTVTSERVILTRDNEVLEAGIDYRFSYNPTIRTINLTSTSGVWSPFHEYVIALNDGLDGNGVDASGDPGIRDLATNLLRPNQPNGDTMFTIVLGNAPAPGISGGVLFDFGDAGPDYPTLDADNGAKHRISADVYLGDPNTAPHVNSEPDGQPSINMAADAFDDGVQFPDTLRTGKTSTIRVIAKADLSGGAEAYVDAWIDFDQNGTWDAGEHVIVSQPVTSGVHDFTVSVPIDAAVGTTGGRFRISQVSTDLAPDGDGGIGEVEDYLITIRDNFDYGDANVIVPAGLQEARHQVVPDWHLGSRIDADNVAPRSSNAAGDGSDDDGIRFGGTGIGGDLPEIEIGRTAIMTVTASQDGFLQAWIDMNADGFLTADEQVVSQRIDAGTSTITAAVPENGVEGITVSRFRFGSTDNLGAFGEADDGEVEDYQLILVPPSNSWHFAPDPTDVEGAGNGAQPMDALLVINELNEPMFSHPTTGLLDDPATPPPFFDVDNDGYVSPLDALLVINQLDQNAQQQAPLSAALPLNVTGEADLSEQRSDTPSAATPVTTAADQPVVNDLVLRLFHSRSRQRRSTVASDTRIASDDLSNATTIDALFAELDLPTKSK